MKICSWAFSLQNEPKMSERHQGNSAGYNGGFILESDKNKTHTGRMGLDNGRPPKADKLGIWNL